MISAKGNTRRILDCYKLFEPAPGISENFDFLSFGKSYANTHFIWYRDPNPGVALSSPGGPPRDGHLKPGVFGGFFFLNKCTIIS